MLEGFSDRGSTPLISTIDRTGRWLLFCFFRQKNIPQESCRMLVSAVDGT